MKITNYLLLVLFLACGINSYSQDLPPNFREKVKKEYELIPPQIDKKESKISFNQYFDQRKDEYLNSQKFYKTLLSSSSVSNLCDNGTFESGNINTGDWNFFWSGGGQTGTNRNNTGSFNSGGTHNNQVHHQVQSTGTDPYFSGLNMVPSYPTGNSNSLRLGNANSGCGLESIAKVITVTPSNSQLLFSYAIVMDNPAGHGNALPYFEVNLINSSNTSQNYNNLVNLGNNSNRISSNNPLLVPNNTTAPRRWKNWACVSADLSSLIGQTIIIEFVNRDCWACGHWSYTYIDNLCIACEGDDEGSIELNLSQTDTCGIPGQICVDYTLPNGNNPSLNLSLELIQNGTVVNTINSPSLNSGSTYCFQLNSSNTNSLNTILQGFDFKIIGNPFIGSFPLSPKIIGSSSFGNEIGQNNDYDIFCSQCCPGRNLVQNGNFENGNTGFTSAYSYKSSIGVSSILPGEYGIINGNQAGIISPTWSNIQDPTSCSNSSGNFLIVNGENGGAVPPQKIIWEQTIPINDWKGYKFCMKAKNLDQCGFNVTPKINVVFSMSQLGNINETINLTTTNPCEWKEIEKTFNLWGYGNSLNIKIILDQSQLGDGNDIAIDDISLIELPQANVQLASFGVTPPSNSGGGNFSFSALPNSLPSDCYFSWEVCELDNSDQCINSTKIYNPSQWWATPFNFVGYNGTSTLTGINPGVFSFTKKYRITRGVWCECESWNQYSVDVNSTAQAIIFTDNKTGKVISKTNLSQMKRRK